MPEIKLEHVTKRWGKFYAVDDLDLVIENNSFVTLLGPSGCGKTTTLRMIAGLETPTSGRITIGDQVVFDSKQGINVPANKRKVGFLFQNYALWPNMTVYDNIAFGLSNVKEELPTVDFEAKNAARLAEILENPGEVVKILEDCRDKKGKIDEKKAYIKLIDAFTLSIYTAKKLYGYHLEQGKDMSSEIASLRAKVDSARKSQTLNENFEVMQNGQVVTQVRKLSKEEIDLAVRRVSRIVKIGMFMDRYPAELSGGQQQRVAIARTLAPKPTVLFMDEPLSNLDAKLRLEMRYELQRLHVETGSTFVYVTHDQMEAMTLATQICLINNGVLQQYDAPLTVYNRPNNLFVADFVGNPSINFVEAKGAQRPDGAVDLTVFAGRKATFRPKESLDLNQWFLDRDARQAAQEAAHKEKAAQKSYVEKGNKDETFRYHISTVVEYDDSLREEPVLTNQDLVLGIRPEFLDIVDDSCLEGEIYGAMPTGMESTIKVRIDDFLLTGVIFGSSLFTIGAKAPLSISGKNIMLFDRKSGQCIAVGSLEFEA
ncbi:MAG: ATP-binding cassette domain-containing protein [Flintibacter sp.]|uniref:ABC transporter ATP-binding protein n=1 Tax=Flintibacter sp. TaxID=1918624 RepID=UPI001F22F983|nr:MULTISPECIES: ABC transporter ATP-binding protein [Eubacteriales]MCF2675281.1 ATP-binding cassette domain-containing protein [Pseudoflavonifractor phocaeensis]MCI6149852.1 ATP-binding cassette domain-containing protein [Flintibacter sp.]MDD7116328.1 ATP-binding cassette domain-containing protein [Flintibacter sp.]MDY5037288.1 ATP-binding cassette domain-containing protein [Lawsonibacter sp.]